MDIVFTLMVQSYILRVIPFKGSWIEFNTDINDVMYAYIDRKKKVPVTTLLRTIDMKVIERYCRF